MTKRPKAEWKVLVEIVPLSYHQNQWFTFNDWFRARNMYRNNVDFREYANMKLRVGK